ncbi:hypothetical protein CPC08DRAFT_317260 [Agrocybe pediades]|nr:hypothetical protein CPC08DRAFT_317260 [Agrocybe pediades]
MVRCWTKSVRPVLKILYHFLHVLSGCNVQLALNGVRANVNLFLKVRTRRAMEGGRSRRALTRSLLERMRRQGEREEGAFGEVGLACCNMTSSRFEESKARFQCL